MKPAEFAEVAVRAGFLVSRCPTSSIRAGRGARRSTTTPRLLARAAGAPQGGRRPSLVSMCRRGFGTGHCRSAKDSSARGPIAFVSSDDKARFARVGGSRRGRAASYGAWKYSVKDSAAPDVVIDSRRRRPLSPTGLRSCARRAASSSSLKPAARSLRQFKTGCLLNNVESVGAVGRLLDVPSPTSTQRYLRGDRQSSWTSGAGASDRWRSLPARALRPTRSISID